MITLILNTRKPLTQEIYNNFIAKLPLHQIECNCGQAGCLDRHAYYRRMLKQQESTISLRILRVKCEACGRTHAILVDQIVPYEQVASDVQQKMIQFKFSSDEIQELLDENLDITDSDVYAVKRRYKEQWKERLNTMKKKITDSLGELIRSSFSEFHRQFMQIRRGINLEFFAVHIA